MANNLYKALLPAQGPGLPGAPGGPGLFRVREERKPGGQLPPFPGFRRLEDVEGYKLCDIELAEFGQRVLPSVKIILIPGLLRKQDIFRSAFVCDL